MKPFKIIQCDKNVGSFILSNYDYNRMCLEYLNDKRVYIQLLENPLEKVTFNINSILKELKGKKEISNRLYSKLKIKKSKIGSFRILIKVHKKKLGLRPIINSILHPTSNLCKFIELLLGPYVREFDSYIQA